MPVDMNGKPIDASDMLERVTAERNEEIKETDRMRVKLIRVEDELAARSSDLRAALYQRDRERIAREKAEAKAARLAAECVASRDCQCATTDIDYCNAHLSRSKARAAVDAHGDLKGATDAG